VEAVGRKYKRKGEKMSLNVPEKSFISFFTARVER